MNSDWPFSITRLDLHRLLRLFMAKFVLMRVIKSATDLTNVSFADRSVQLDDDILAAVMAMRTMLADSDDLADSVRHFYVAIVEKIVKIFPFHDTVLKALSVLHDTWSPTMVCNLATRFSNVADDEIEHLVEEFQDDLPAFTSDSRVDTLWAEMGRKKIFVGAVWFPLLTHVMTTPSVIAHSNADSERVFSMVRKIDTDSRSQLGNDTLRALLSCKINKDDTYYAFVSYKDLCKAAKDTRQDEMMSSIIRSDPEPIINGDFDHRSDASFGSDDELIKVGEIELKDPFRSIENNEGTILAVRKITKVTTLKRQRSRASSIVDPERTNEIHRESDSPDDDSSDSDGTDDNNRYSGRTDEGDGYPGRSDGNNEDPGRPHGINADPDISHQDPFAYLDNWNEHDIEEIPKANNNYTIISDNTQYRNTNVHISVDRKRVEGHIDISKDIKIVTENGLGSQLPSTEQNGSRDVLLPSSPGSAKRRLSSIGNPDYYNYAWRPILGKYKKPDQDQDNKVYWKVVHEKTTKDTRVTNEGDNIKKTETEEWKHLQDSRNHQIQQSTKVDLNVIHKVHDQSMISESLTQGSEHRFSGDHSTRQDNQSETSAGINDLYDTSAAKPQNGIIREDRFDDHAIMEDDRLRQQVEDRLYLRSSSQNDQRRESVDQWFYEHSTIENRQRMTDTQIEEDLYSVINPNHKPDITEANRSLLSITDSKQSTLQRTGELNDNVRHMEESVNVRSVFTEREFQATNNFTSSLPNTETAPQTGEWYYRLYDSYELVDALFEH
ncbi:hypothetical protein LSH36_1015g00014 [Paralvinella palmiformis]|uniref:HAT C-terminal dimerisation domain-containing protein n=1 Tax=Paralvinella palmiformis TaxID=53620 RepID=A0AAD9IW14_9ANNE|nr:hypothetical protein LSH36_1015g00014 [Paralvinella palmiformis]